MREKGAFEKTYPAPDTTQKAGYHPPMTPQDIDHLQRELRYISAAVELLSDLVRDGEADAGDVAEALTQCVQGMQTRAAVRSWYPESS